MNDRAAASHLPRLVLFSGGTACRTINIALCKRQFDLVRVVPAWDSGGSSKALRETFSMLPVGDIRQALMTMAHGEGHAGEVVKICNARLSDQLGPAELRAEFDYYLTGRHPLLQRMPAEVREAILGYLGLFNERLPGDFDFSNGSIGNFILTGAYFANGFNINRAVAVFRRLCRIEGNVWPVSAQDDVQLGATLRNGKELPRQHLITRMDETDGLAGIAELKLTSRRGDQVASNDVVLEAISRADAIIFGPGSFYTSILPHLLVDGVAVAVAANRRAPKILVGNILECAETRGASLGGLVETFVGELKSRTNSRQLVTHVLSNSELFPFQKTVGKFAYLKHGELDAFCWSQGIMNTVGDFEDAWTRGQHDGEAIADALQRIVAPAAAQLS